MARPARPSPRRLETISKRFVTPNMLRVTLGGEEIRTLPKGSAGGYVKLRLPDAQNAGKPVVRTYTIRAQRADEIDIDFALHGTTSTGTAGPATEWALNAQPGDIIEVGGPGPAKPLLPGAPFYLLAGDMTALPAISVNLENLSPDARGVAFIEVMSEDDRQQLIKPDGFDVIWIESHQPGSEAERFVAAVRDFGWADAGLHAWSASEFSVMRLMRSYLRDERGLGPDRLYISSYWKSGLTEDNHKVLKRQDAESTLG